MGTETDKIRSIVEKFCSVEMVLDVGCGENKIVPHAIGMDKVHHPCVTICGSISNLKLWGSGQFGVVYSSHFLEHIKKPAVMIKEMLRVLKKNGVLILYLPDKSLYTVDNPEHLHKWNSKDFKKLMPKNVRLVKEDIVDYSFLLIYEKIK